MKSLGHFFRRCTPRTASSMPWFTKYSASYRCAFSMTKHPFSGVAASSEVNVARRDTRLPWSRVPTRMDTRIQLDQTTAGNARRAEVWTVRWKQLGDRWVAPKGRTRYFLFQPSLPLNQATLIRGALVLDTPARPA